MVGQSLPIPGRHHLDADVAEAAGADDDALVARPQPPGRLGRGVVGRQTGVGERRDVLRLEGGVELHAAARRRLEVLGVPAVGVDAGERAVLAVNVVAEPAGAAQPAGDQRVEDHLVADRDAGRVAALAAVLPPDVRSRFCSFGTCSIAEPLEELVGLGLLPAGDRPCEAVR